MRKKKICMGVKLDPSYEEKDVDRGFLEQGAKEIFGPKREEVAGG
jgi:hypothetical protein